MLIGLESCTHSSTTCFSLAHFIRLNLNAHSSQMRPKPSARSTTPHGRAVASFAPKRSLTEQKTAPSSVNPSKPGPTGARRRGRRKGATQIGLRNGHQVRAIDGTKVHTPGRDRHKSKAAGITSIPLTPPFSLVASTSLISLRVNHRQRHRLLALLQIPAIEA